MGPLNEQLRKSGEEALLFTEELANWFVDHFGGNFADMKRFTRNVMEEKLVEQDEFLSDSIKPYVPQFMTVCKNPKARAILDDLVKLDNFESPIGYDVDALDKLIEQNIIALHAKNYSWNKRIVCVAYKDFVETERRKKPWYRFF